MVSTGWDRVSKGLDPASVFLDWVRFFLGLGSGTVASDLDWVRMFGFDKTKMRRRWPFFQTIDALKSGLHR